QDQQILFHICQYKYTHMLAFANAKINIGLNVTEKRADGYHLLETVFYPVKLYDVVEITDAKHTHCIVKGMAVPGNEADNLCLKAFDMLAKDFDLPPQQITLLKNIPIGAGLGGGSSDAAFLLKLVNDKFKLQLSNEVLQAYARQLGADCPFFIENKPMFARGIGDELEDLTISLEAYYLVLVKPPIHVSTVNAYASIIPKKPETSLKDFIHLPVEHWKQGIKNDFEASVGKFHPEIEAIKTELYHAGAIFSLMSGSGSTVYAVFTHKVQLPSLEKKYKVFYNV
ncbi:4-(cytidine 5'-diphospho)-2-C-methyl-D-erythritol kinase, partial [Pedobacter sp.]|uniref:4-(cytidine 5'-diphospho)-2-C-methyl-D-erythritol kinase n=1 Tax=Pedobacter sp. TaxID=1411316 RepID=UPI003D7F84DE